MYRDQPVDPRIAELEALIAAEPGLRAQLVPLRLEHDELVSRADVIGPRLSEASAELANRRDGGVVASLTEWFGRSIEHLQAEVTELTTEIEVASKRIAELVALEQELVKKLEAAGAARSQLAELRTGAIEALRIAGGPAGDEVRALDADDRRDELQRAAIVAHIDVIDFAQTSLVGVVAVRDELEKLTGTASKFGIITDVLDAPFSRPQTLEDRDATRVRLDDAVALAITNLGAVVSGYDDTGCSWLATMPRSSVLGYAQGNPADTQLVANADALVDAMFELARGLADVRDRLVRQRDERQARRLEIAGLAT